VLYLRLIILLVEGDVPVDSEMLLVIDFVNIKIKPTQSFRCAHRGRVCMHIFIGVSVYAYLHLYYISKKEFYQRYAVIFLQKSSYC
jgi:hypothetical protein